MPDLSDLTVGFCSPSACSLAPYHINEHKLRDEGSTLFVYESPHHMLAKLRDKLLTGQATPLLLRELRETRS